MNNSTIESRALQAYEEFASSRNDTRWFKPTEHGIALQVSSKYSPSRSPRGTETLVMTFQGKYVRAQVKHSTKQPPPPHKRATIKDFSPQSRGRLFDLFNKMELKSKVVFITLTYEGIDTDASTAKAHLFAFVKRLQRRFANASMSFVWRMEFQQRGAIHFHVLAFGLPFVPKEQIQIMWGETTCQNRPFTRIEMIFSSKKIMNYVAKYVAKVNPPEIGGFNLPTYLAAYQSQNGDEIGRVWGVIGKKYLPMAECVTLELAFNYANFMKFRYIASHQFPPIWDSLALGFRLYVLSAKQWEHYFHCLYDTQF
jgi:hypothetical protein